MTNATFVTPDLTMLYPLDDPGLNAIGQHITAQHTALPYPGRPG